MSKKKPCRSDRICSLINKEAISMSRGREVLGIKYMEEMREIYNRYVRKIN